VLDLWLMVVMCAWLAPRVVAHELNNPLAVLVGQAQLLQRGAKDHSLVQRVEEHGGAVTVDSEPGRCTTFTITLPVVPQPAGAGEPSAAEVAAPVGSKAILVIDDERDLAEVLVEELEHDGHRVEVASNGAEALSRLERQAFDLVLSDTKMPHIDGLELYREIERRYPAASSSQTSSMSPTPFR